MIEIIGLMRCSSLAVGARFRDGLRAQPWIQRILLKFSALTGIRPMIEKFPLAKVAEAYDRMASGKVRFRAVLTMG